MVVREISLQESPDEGGPYQKEAPRPDIPGFVTAPFRDSPRPPAGIWLLVGPVLESNRKLGLRGILSIRAEAAPVQLGANISILSRAEQVLAIDLLIPQCNVSLYSEGPAA